MDINPDTDRPYTGDIAGKIFVRKGCHECVDAVCDNCTRTMKFRRPPSEPLVAAIDESVRLEMQALHARCVPMASESGARVVKGFDAPPTPTAQGILTAAAKHMADRAKTYDKPEGERSMGKTVDAFNAITGRDLQESEGWLLMQILKDVRDRQRAEPHVDSLEDGVAYAALKAEARMGGR